MAAGCHRLSEGLCAVLVCQGATAAVVTALWGLWGFFRAVREDREAAGVSGGSSIRVVVPAESGAIPVPAESGGGAPGYLARGVR